MANTLEELAIEFDEVGSKYPKEVQAFLKKEGNKLRSKVAKNVKANANDRGVLYKSIKRGKPYAKDGSYSVRVYSYCPHAHLVEYGHIQKDKSGKEYGFVKGKHIFSKEGDAYTSEFYDHIDEFIDDLFSRK